MYNNCFGNGGGSWILLILNLLLCGGCGSGGNCGSTCGCCGTNNCGCTCGCNNSGNCNCGCSNNCSCDCGC